MKSLPLLPAWTWPQGACGSDRGYSLTTPPEECLGSAFPVSWPTWVVMILLSTSPNTPSELIYNLLHFLQLPKVSLNLTHPPHLGWVFDKNGTGAPHRGLVPFLFAFPFSLSTASLHSGMVFTSGNWQGTPPPPTKTTESTGLPLAYQHSNHSHKEQRMFWVLIEPSKFIFITHTNNLPGDKQSNGK